MQMNRRDFIMLSSLFSFTICAPKFLRAEGVELAKTSGKVLVPIFLRGGLDGMSLIVPYGDTKYYEARKTIALAKPGQENGVVNMDGFFGINPRAQAFMNLFKNNALKVLLGVGHDKNTRSHFTEQDVWETGTVNDYMRSDGLLNKFLATSQNSKSILRALSFGESLPHMMRGSAQTFALRNLDDIFMGKNSQEVTANILEEAYSVKQNSAKASIQKTGSDVLAGLKEIRTVLGDSYETKIEYPKGNLARRLKDAARLIKSNLGVEVIHIDIGGWDTHQNQAPVSGAFGNKVQDLADSLWAFYQDLETKMDDVLVLIFSEFGRTVFENGTSGTDHGWGNCMLAMGGSIPKASQSNSFFLNDWPGLAPDQLIQKRDLKNTIDFRNVYGEIFLKHMGYQNPQNLIPDFEFNFPGLLKT